MPPIVAFPAVLDAQRWRCRGAAERACSPSPSRAHRSAHRRRRPRHCAACLLRVRRRRRRRPRAACARSRASTLTPRLGIVHVRADLVEQVLQRMAALGVEKAARRWCRSSGTARRVASSSCGVRLGPLGRADQPRLLAVPAGIDQRAARPPAALQQRADRLGLRHHRHVARRAGPRRRTPSRRGDCRARPTRREARCR